MTFSKELANAIRFLSIDAVEQAQSGHPGMPLGMADIATVLWLKYLKHNPKNPHWFNRDRFILSNGHGSMLLYSLLHLTGYALSLEEIKNFRQLHSKTPGHPENIETPGVETTTGPLGQGLANGVGMAIAEKVLSQTFNQVSYPLVDHYTYVFVGDGCLMEGISHEVCSLAGTLGLGKLIVFYDDNGISIDGKVDSWFTDNTALRFKSYNWHVIEHIDGHDFKAIDEAIAEAQREQNKPTLIICKTIIGYGTNVAGSEQAHGAPLPSEDIKGTRQRLEWPYAPFEIPNHLYQAWNHEEQGKQAEQEWLHLCYQYQKDNPDEFFEFLRRINGDLPEAWHAQSNQFIEQCLEFKKDVATRKASQMCLEALGSHLPELLGGSADLTGSNNTNWSKTKALSASDFHGNYIYYGVREFGMSAIMNGLALHGGFIPYGGTFLVFADYARNALRLSALMRQRVIYIYSHDSIGLGEDGPTHQPIEHITMLRVTPNLMVWRPACLVETAVSWQQALEHHTGPSALLLSRQNLPRLPLETKHIEYIKRGAYIVNESPNPDAIIIGTGSEVHIALKAAEELLANGLSIRVVSMPCAELFLSQEQIYRDTVLPPSIRKRVAIEAGATTYWYRFVGLDGLVLGIDRFGASGKASDIYTYLGLTAERVIQALKTLCQRN